MCKENKYKIIGIGETGIDLFGKNTEYDLLKQIKAFEYQINLSIEYD